MNRTVTLASAFLAGALAAGALATYAQAPTPATHDDPKHGSVRVLAHKCDDAGGVSALLLTVEGEGQVAMSWSNEGICGKRV